MIGWKKLTETTKKLYHAETEFITLITKFERAPIDGDLESSYRENKISNIQLECDRHTDRTFTTSKIALTSLELEKTFGDIDTQK